MTEGGKNTIKGTIGKGVVVAIVVLFLGYGIIPSTGNIGENTYDVDVKKVASPLGNGAAWFACDVSTDTLWEFGYGGSVLLGEAPGTSFLTGGTWIPDCDYPWWAAEYGTNTNGSALWRMNTQGEYEQVTANCGGTLSGLAFDPVTEQLYGCDVDKLYMIDMETGNATLIGPMPGRFFIEMGINEEGQGYGIDIQTDCLYKINLEDASTELVGSLGFDLQYAQDCEFDLNAESAVFYLLAFDGMEANLLICDTETGHCTLVGGMQPGEWTAFAIPYGYITPSAHFQWTPIHPYIGETILFNASESFDPDGYITLYAWDWDGDGFYEESGSSPLTTHCWWSEGVYPVTLLVLDNEGAYGTSTQTITVYENHPPETPVIHGLQQGTVGTEYTYHFPSFDPDGDTMYVFWDWGDGSTSGWSGPYASGNEIYANHTWLKKGTYLIKAKLKDGMGAESDWGTVQVKMPVSNTMPVLPFFERLMERFPHAFPLLRYLVCQKR